MITASLRFDRILNHTVIPYLVALVPLGLIVLGLRRRPVRTAALILPFWPILLIVGTVLSFTAKSLLTTLLVVAAWLFSFAGLLFATRPDDPVPVPDTGTYAPVMQPWMSAGFTETDMFRLRPRDRSTIVAMRRPNEATVFVMAVRDGADHPGTWALSTPLGEGIGALVTTSDPVGMLDFGEIRQIVTGSDAVWETHQAGLEFCGAAGIAIDRQVGDSPIDHVVWMRARDRTAARHFPLGFLVMMFRPMFHLGPLPDRRRAQRQIRGLRS